MANIKFSQFTVGNTESDIDFVVGYKGANNIQISPANLLSATLAGYLPLTGGTITGNVVFTDSVSAYFGTSNDLRIFHNGSNSFITQNGTGDLRIVTNVDDGDILFQSDDGSGGVTEYFRLDGSTVQNTFSKTTNVIDNFYLGAGNSTDLYLTHDGTNSSIINNTGNLTIQNNHNDGDILFRSDDGSGGTATYLFLDGQNTRTEFLKDVKFPDNVKANFGTSVDLQIKHDGSNSYISNNTGALYVQQLADNSDIVFQSDDGSGGVTEYFRLDGTNQRNIFSKNVGLGDNVIALFGSGNDMQLFHDSVQSQILNLTGNLRIRNFSDDSDITFESDDGSGGIATYFFLDGSRADGTYLYTEFPDNSIIGLGNDTDLQIYHNSTNSVIDNYTGDLTFQQKADDKDIIFKCDDGSGGVTTYFQLDGSNTNIKFNKDLYLLDNVKARIGTGSDLQIYHEGTDSIIQNYTGSIYIDNNADNQDIVFRCDDGSGGLTEYFRLDGSATQTKISLDTKYVDNAKAKFGDSNDLEIFHSGASSSIRNQTGDLYIQNLADDKDIIFQSDDGSGGALEYFRLDGSTTKIQINREMQFFDNVKATFGFAADLQIYHDGSNSFITESNTGGSLIIRGSNFAVQSSDGTDDFITTLANQGVKLFYNDVEKLETTTTGIKISGVSEYADNTAAIAGGLTTGDVYRTGDLLKIVH